MAYGNRGLSWGSVDLVSTLRPTNDVAQGSIGLKEEDQVSAGDLPGIRLFVRSMGIQDKVNTGVFYHSSSSLYSATDYRVRYDEKGNVQIRMIRISDRRYHW
jgi:hypothetical protein